MHNRTRLTMKSVGAVSLLPSLLVFPLGAATSKGRPEGQARRNALRGSGDDQASARATFQAP